MTSSAFRIWLASLADAEATVPARVVLEHLPDDEGRQEAPRLDVPADLTCEDVAKRHSRTPACVRAWCRDGKIPGAYRLQGRR